MFRRSFLPCIPEFDEAATLLSQAADAYLSGNNPLCEKLLIEADLRPLRDFAYLVAGPINPEIHRQSKNPSYVPLPRSELPRMPNASVTRNVYSRDGYRCRFCEARVIVKEARKGGFKTEVQHLPPVRSAHANILLALSTPSA